MVTFWTMNFKGKISKDADRRKGTATWLRRSDIRFDHSLTITGENKKVAENLFYELVDLSKAKKVSQKLLDFEILIANLINRPKRPISVSLNVNNWKKDRYKRASYFIIDLIKILNNKQLIKMKLGYKFSEESNLTRIWAEPKLLEYFPEYKTCIVSKPVSLIELSDDNNKLLEFKETATTWKIREILELANKVNGSAEITYLNTRLHTNLIAIFKNKLTLYGRLHTSGFRHVQGLSGDERAEILINGNPVVELDYSALHPNLLYATEGIQYNGDPYTVIDKRSKVRPFLKIILLCMINSKDEKTAVKASDNWLYENKMQSRILKRLAITKSKPFIEAFKTAHAPIEKYFCKGKITGMKIMNKDSKIALEVVNHFVKKNIPILPIHDSFIVERQYKNELLDVMNSAYAKQTGGFRIKIKEN